jgi:hypothetical protein
MKVPLSVEVVILLLTVLILLMLHNVEEKIPQQEMKVLDGAVI